MNIARASNDDIAREQTLQFFLWASSALGFDVTAGDAGRYTLDVPADDRDALGTVEKIQFSPSASAAPNDASCHPDHVRFERLTPDSRLFTWLIERLHAKPPLHAAPRSQPESVHQLTPRLFDGYTVDDGRVHLAGCRLEDIPFVRLTFRVHPKAAGSSRVAHVFFTEDGQVADDDQIAALGLDDLRPLQHPARSTDQQELQQLLAVAQAQARSVWSEDGADLLASVVIWCKYARVKLSFVVGEETVHVKFADWAKMIADGRVDTPPYRCPQTGRESYDLAATDDGHITAAESIDVCAQTGQRVLASQLVTCAATGQRVQQSLTDSCPVSGDRVARSAVVDCSMCQQPVSPTALRSGRCSACRGVRSVARADPRMAHVLDEYPGLDRWRRWKISETKTVYVLVATAFFRRLLLVVDKETLEPIRVATGSWPGSGWSELPPILRDETLG